MRWLRLRRRPDASCFGLVLALIVASMPLPAAAEGPPEEPEARERARAAFVRFATGWLAASVRVAREPADGGTGVLPGPDPDFTVELRPTGSARSPYVGLLHYRERLADCGGSQQDCVGGATVSVTEIFRFQNGHWVQ